jgi:glutaconate CoA-transferase, subunit B
MAIVLSRELRDGELGMMGATSLVPVAASLLAQQLQAPNLTVILPSGIVNPKPGRLYRSASDGRWASGAEAIGTAYDLFELSENGRLDFMFYGGIQLDRYGNINLTQVGTAQPPAFRGPGLANISFAVMAKRYFLFAMSHTARTFVERVDYRTAPGHLEGDDSRSRAGITTEGPVFGITPMIAFDFDERKHMRVRSIHEAIDPQTVIEATGFSWPEGAPWPVTPEPSELELTTLRGTVDTTGLLRTRVTSPGRSG